MKHSFLALGVIAVLFFSSCGESSTSSTTTSGATGDTGVSTSESTTSAVGESVTNTVNYVDLNTGQNFQLQYDTVKQVTMNTTTGKPVEIYVNSATMDTFDTRGINVNNALERGDAGWTISKDKMKMKSGDKKIKTDGDKIKIKDGDTKTKIEGEDIKIKTDDIKIKQEDGEMKVKDK